MKYTVTMSIDITNEAITAELSYGAETEDEAAETIITEALWPAGVTINSIRLDREH